MAAHMRPGDRTFFIYDHSVTKKECDDPKDAIIYYFPQHTSVDVQCTFCNQLMGMVNCTKAIAGAPPVLYKLRKIKVATIHEGNFTVALACKLRTPDTAIIRKLENLYKVFAFYHCSIARVKKLSSDNEAFLSNMAAIWDFYVPYVRRYGNIVPAVFEPIRSAKLLKGGNVFFLRCSHLLQWLKGQPSLLAGCILYRQSVLCTQLTPELTSHLLLIKPNQLHHPSKSVTDTVLPFGVRIMSVYVTRQQYELVSAPLEPLLEPRPSPVQVKQPASPTEKPSSDNQQSTNNQATSRRTLERRITSKLFSNFTGMLEGSVVESLWPSTSKSSRPSSRSESPWDTPKREKAGSPNLMQDCRDTAAVLSRSRDDLVGALQHDGVSPERDLSKNDPYDVQMVAAGKYRCPSSMQDGDFEIVALSGSSDNVVKALQGDGGSSVNELTGSVPGDGQVVSRHQTTHDVPDSEQRPINCPDLLTNPGSSQNNSKTVSEALPVKHDTTTSTTRNETCTGYVDMNLPNGNGCLDDRQQSSTWDRQMKDMLLEQKVHSDRVQENHASTGLDIAGASTEESRRNDLGEEAISESNKQLLCLGKSPKAIPSASEQKSESPESGIGDCLVEARHEDLSRKDTGAGEKDHGFVEGEQSRSSDSVDVIPANQTVNATSDQCLCTDVSKSELDENGYHANGNVSLLISTETLNEIPANITLDDVDTNSECNSYGEEKSPSVTETSVSNREVGNILDTFDGETLPKDSQINDLLKSTRDEPREDPDLREPSTGEVERTEDLKGGILNVKYEETDLISGESFLAEEGGHSDEGERTILAEDEGTEALIDDGQESLNINAKSDNEEPSDMIKSNQRSSCYLDAKEQVPQSREEDNSEMPQELVEEAEWHGADVQSLVEKSGNESDYSVHRANNAQESGQALGISVQDVKDSQDAPGVHKDARQEEVCEPHGGHATGIEEAIQLITSSSSFGTKTREDESLRDNIDGTSGKSCDESGSARWEDIVESCEGCAAESPMLEGDTSTMQDGTELIPDLVNLSLYVQAHSDTTLLFLAEKSITKEKETLFQLWQSVLRELGELELQLKHVVRPDQELDCRGAYNIIHVDNEQKSLEASISNPINQAESVFCRGTQHIHEQFLSDETLTDVTLRNYQTVVYAHRNACQHTFYHKNHKPSPTPGIPARDDAALYIQNSCKEALREHNINLL